MKRLHIYFFVIAVLISALFHLFLLNAAYKFTIKLRLFENTAAEEMFRIKTVERPRRNRRQRSELSPEDHVSLERPEDRARSEADLEDRRKMLAQRGLISFDASEAEINEALKKLFEGESLEPDPNVKPELTAERLVAQEVIAIEESVAGERITVPTRTIVNNTQRGWATSDVYVPDEAASPDQLQAGSA